MRLAYLGPPGTFTEEALLCAPEAAGAELAPLSTVPDVIASVASGDAWAGMVPIENSIEGSVNVTLDTLAFDSEGVWIVREVVRPIRHALLARRGLRASDLTAVVSHPHATAQCRGFLARVLPRAEVRAANSTSEAAREVASRPEPWGAIGARLAAELYGLEVLVADIEDRRENTSRFVLVARDRPAPTGSDKTSVVCFIEKDRPGSLLAILHEFGDRGINLTKLESRPTKERLGEYCFFIDMEGHAEEPPVRHAIESLRTKILDVKILGSYPRAPISGSEE
ncbi:MAG: prephenate dehydratase [Acidobacteria bacterium]|nr:prephenate dehydratase [Acidobacteriota bacterium]